MILKKFDIEVHVQLKFLEKYNGILGTETHYFKI